MIQKYFTETMIVKRKNRLKINGVWKESLDDVETFKGAIDKDTTVYTYSSDKESFEFTDLVFAPIGTDVKEDDIIEHESNNYSVESVKDPMRRKHHLEIRLRRLK
jgi:uncharacterized Zn finger protein